MRADIDDDQYIRAHLPCDAKRQVVDDTPSAKSWPSTSMAAKMLGTDIEARIARLRLPWSNMTSLPSTMLVATARKGITRWSNICDVGYVCGESLKC